jgi:hypothetical protein
MFLRDQEMKALALCLILVLAAPCSGRNAATGDEAILERAKAIDVARLDPTLQPRGLDEWLRLGPPRLEKLDWHVNQGCDLKATGPEPAEGYPLCVRLSFSRGGVSGSSLIRVGTTKKGIEGEPRFEYAVVHTDLFHEVRKLSELPSLLGDAELDQPLGTWRGTSICTKVRASCRDEQVVYRIARGAKAGTVAVAAHKIVDGQEVEMGTLELTVDPAQHHMTGDYDSGTVASRWTFTWTATEVTGTAVVLPSGDVIRNVSLRR